jgi:toxin ParE1/3/4
MRVVLGDEARSELREAAAWYRKISKRLARRFGDEIKAAVALVAADPLRRLEIEPGIRRVLLRKFPYALLYTVEGNRVVVLVLKHHKRHPDYWHDDR